MSIVIPVFNEADGLPELRKRLIDVLEPMGLTFEIILIDDGSTDASRERIVAFHRQDARICGLFLSRNFGHQIAITAGLQHARGNAVAIMDADLQDPPETLPIFLQKLKEGYDVVYGIRRKRKENALKRLSYYLFYRLLNRLSEQAMPLDSGDFCIMTRRIVNHLNTMPERHRFLRGLRTWAGYRQTGVEYERDYRFAGVPKYSFSKLFNLAIDGLISFSSIPVRMMIHFGFFTAFISFVTGLAYLILKLIGIGNWPSGFATLFLLIAFLGGIQLITIGMIGEYIGRIHMEVKNRPLFLISDYIGIQPVAQINSFQQPSD